VRPSSNEHDAKESQKNKDLFKEKMAMLRQSGNDASMRSKSSVPALSPKKKTGDMSAKRATEEEEDLKPIKRSKGGLLSS
jgi:hypothetical protein